MKATHEEAGPNQLEKIAAAGREFRDAIQEVKSAVDELQDSVARQGEEISRQGEQIAALAVPPAPRGTAVTDLLRSR